MTNKEPYTSSNLYYDYDLDICPICGKKIKHPYTGEVSIEQIDEDIETCLWMENIDEGGSTIGYTPCCKNIHPWTTDEDDHKYIHYDLVELVNNWDEPLEVKKEYIIELVLKSFPDVEKESIIISSEDNIVTNIILSEHTSSFTIDIGNTIKEVLNNG